MNKEKKILIAEKKDFSEEVVHDLSQYAKVDIYNCSEKDIPEALKNYDVFWFRLAFKFTRKLLEDPGIRCRILATPVTGIDHIDEEACRDHGIKIVCLRGETEFLKSVRATAELTLGLTLSLMRNIVEANLSVRNGEWKRDLFRGTELFGKTAGIIGYGRLGTIAAEYFKAFGMKVLIYDVNNILVPSYIKVANSIEDLLKKSDVVSIHVNYNAANHHLLSRKEFALLKKEAVLINTSRGGIVDENALLEALKNNTLAGAALDVLQGEPDITENHPLVAYSKTHSNLLIVPHIGGNTFESFQKTEKFIAGKIIELIKKGEV